MIVTDEELLRRPCEPVKSRQEGGEIARRLLATLERLNKKAAKFLRKTGGKTVLPTGVGLAAPQIGVLKQVCVILVDKPIILMNPVIVAHSATQLPAKEGCLSFPGQTLDTWRYVWVSVQVAGHPTPLTLGPIVPEEWTPTSLLTAVVAQHEIDHLFSVLFFDRTKEESGNVDSPCYEGAV